MKNGSLAHRILKAVGRRRIVRRRDLERLGGYDQVGRALRRLEEEGFLEKIDRGVWLRLGRAVGRQMHARAWSTPGGASDDKVLRLTLAQPSFDDLAALCLSLGLKRADMTLSELRADNEISPRVARRDEEIIANVRAGLLRMARADDRSASR